MPPQFTREEFQAIQDDFLNTWPVERLKAMTLEEYSNREKTSFTYWLEFKTRWTGSIKGGRTGVASEKSIKNTEVSINTQLLFFERPQP